MLSHFDGIMLGLLEDKDTDSIYLDYAKAFDKVDHDLLIKKLERYGLPPIITKWITSFLKDHSQTVVVHGKHSIAGSIISGVPQGTVLGPILFIIFINDMHLLFDWDHDIALSRSFCRSLVSVSPPTLLEILESSANRRTVDSFIHRCISLMNMIKSIGLRTVPCGTPLIIEPAIECLPLTTTGWLRSLRKDVIHLVIIGVNPYLSSFLMSRSWFTLSNALA